jgi:hypothetical protein
MMADLPDNPTANSASGQVPCGLIVLIGALVGLVAMVVGPPMVEQLLLGWFYFPLRMLPRVTVDWPTVVLGLGSMGAFIVGLHRTVQWLLRRTATNACHSRSWSLRSTLIVAVGFWVLFGAGTAMVAATHQAVWLVSGRPADATNAPRVAGFVSLFREQVDRVQFKNSQHQFGLAYHNAYDAFGTLPAGGTMTRDGRLLHGWAISLGPYHGLNNMQIDFAVPWNQPPNDRLYRCAVPVFLNPSVPEVFDADGYGLSHVAGNVHVLPIVTVADPSSGRSPGDQLFVAEPISRDQGRRFALDDITDGTAHTILIGEVATRFKPWGHPANMRDPALGISRSPDGFGSRAIGGDTLFLMCDGSVRSLSAEIDPSVIRALGTPAANDAAPVDF